ncbi:Tetratricopeptide repeat protein [Azospirillaceae bacterium]
MQLFDNHALLNRPPTLSHLTQPTMMAQQAIPQASCPRTPKYVFLYAPKLRPIAALRLLFFVLISAAILTIAPLCAPRAEDMRAPRVEDARPPRPEEAVNAINQANRHFIQALKLIKQANTTYDSAEEAKLLNEADRLLTEITTRFPETDMAVQLITNQFVGDFDFFEFRTRVKGLVCGEALSSKCFLFRINALLPPVETPIATARWDWLSLAVMHHRLGDGNRAKEIIAPFLSAVRRGRPPESGERDLFVARALALTDQFTTALEITRQINDCSTRIYNLTDIAQTAQWAGQRDLAASLAEEAKTHAATQNCAWEQGLVTMALLNVGREEEARTLFRAMIDRRQPRERGGDARTDCCAPEVALAAATLGETKVAMSLLRQVQDDNPWTAPAVLGRLCGRGECDAALGYVEQLQDQDLRGEALAELLGAFLRRNERPRAEEVMKRLNKLVSDGAGRRPALLAQRAKAEKLLFDDSRWRRSFQQAINLAEQSSSFTRRDIGLPLLAALARIETGLPLLD